MMIFQGAALVVIAAIISVMLKRYHEEYSIFLMIATGVMILILISSGIYSVIQYIKDFFNVTGLDGSYLDVIIKALGICIITQFAADTCTDAGQSALSSQIMLAGKITILVLTLPMMKAVLDIAVSLIRA